MTTETNFGSFLDNWTPPVMTEPKPEPVFEPIKPGDILVAQWGYDANNVEFFKVFKRSKSFIEIAELNQAIQPGDTGVYMGVYAIPGTTWKNYSLWSDREAHDLNRRNDGQPILFRRKIYVRTDGREYIKLAHYANAPRAYLWNGEPCVDYNHH